MKRSIIQSKYIFSLTTIIIFVFIWIFLSSNANNSYAFPSLKVIFESFKRLIVEYHFVVLKTILKNYLKNLRFYIAKYRKIVYNG